MNFEKVDLGGEGAVVEEGAGGKPRGREAGGDGGAREIAGNFVVRAGDAGGFCDGGGGHFLRERVVRQIAPQLHKR